MKKLNDYQILLYSFVGTVCLFTWMASGMCFDYFDEYIMVVFAGSLICVPIVIGKWKKRNS